MVVALALTCSFRTFSSPYMLLADIGGISLSRPKPSADSCKSPAFWVKTGLTKNETNKILLRPGPKPAEIRCLQGAEFRPRRWWIALT